MSLPNIMLGHFSIRYFQKFFVKKYSASFICQSQSKVIDDGHLVVEALVLEVNKSIS